MLFRIIPKNDKTQINVGQVARQSGAGAVSCPDAQHSGPAATCVCETSFRKATRGKKVLISRGCAAPWLLSRRAGSA